MPSKTSAQVDPHLWYIKEAKEAAKFYVKIFPKSRIDRVWKLSGSPVECAQSPNYLPSIFS